MKVRKGIFVLAAVFLAVNLMACGNGSRGGNAEDAEDTKLYHQDQSGGADMSDTETADTEVANAETLGTEVSGSAGTEGADTESAGTEVADTETAEAGSETDGKLVFSTNDLNGHPISSSEINGAKVIMVNFWEPWCGPCVGELSDLQNIYETYREQGLMLLGVFYDSSNKDTVETFVTEKQITYPILIGNDDFAPFTTEYVPTTVFFDGEGNLLSKDPIVGAQSYSRWEKIIEEYLKAVDQ